jgi:hypothetical protein
VFQNRAEGEPLFEIMPRCYEGEAKALSDMDRPHNTP